MTNAKLDVSLAEVTGAGVENWPNRVLLAILLFPWWILISAVRKSFAADLAIHTASGTYHYAVDDAEGWAAAIQGARTASSS